MMTTLYQFAYRYSIAVVKSIKLFLSSIKLWPFKVWLDFWFTFPEEKLITINDQKHLIRSNTLHSKIVDLYMLASCILDRQYEHGNLQIKKTDVIIDIGANIGSFTIHAARKADKGLILSFEPDPDNCLLLKKNVNLNNLNNVRIFQKAVAGVCGKRLIYRDPINNAAHSLIKITSQKISVDCLTLSEIFSTFKINSCDLLKIDCEGAEYEIILNAPADVLKRIQKITLEYHTPKFHDIENETYTPENLVKYLEETGFQTTLIKENAIQGAIWATRKPSV
jgi:FkbM family methyltransferase